jgi:DNA-binding CsgD family transcriptional regulator
MGRGERRRRNLPVTRCEDLQPRHREILRLLAANYTSDQIARVVGLSVHTVNHYLSRDHPSSIFALIGVDNRISAAIWYTRNCGDIQEPEPVFSLPRILLTGLFVCIILFIFVPLGFLKDVRSFPYIYSNIFAVLPATAGIYGLRRYYRLPVDRNPFRRMLWWFSSGLILWAIGQLLWVVWIYRFGEPIPYPGPSDVGYLLCAIFWVIGLYILQKEVIRDANRNLFIAGSISAILLATSVIFTFWARNGRIDLERDPWKLFFDIAYPTIDMIALAILISIVLAPSFRTIGSQIQWMVYMATGGIFALYVADALFSATTSLPENHRWHFYNGAAADITFTIAFWLLGLAITWIPQWYRSRTPEA